MRNPVTIAVKVQGAGGGGQTQQTQQQQQQQPLLQQQATPSSLENWYYVCNHDERPALLSAFLTEHIEHKVIVFCSTCACVDYYSLAFAQLARDPNCTTLPSALKVLGMHGKMVPKKRTGVYRKFVSLQSGVLFCTDVAARGVDIPDVDWIVQLAAPKDPSFFVHRVGRTARAGRRGGALLFISQAEKSYVELIRGRSVPLREKTRIGVCVGRGVGLGVGVEDDVEDEEEKKNVAVVASTSSSSSSSSNSSSSSSISSSSNSISSAGAVNGGDILQDLKRLSSHDRELLELGSTAFMSFLRAYKENLCSYIFRLDQLDIGALARSYGLLRLPKIPETRGAMGARIVFESTSVDTSQIAYKHKEKELARVRRLAAAKAEEEKEKASAAAGEHDDDDDDDDDGDGGDNRSIRSSFSTKSKGGAAAWVPAEEYVAVDEKRKRKKKQGLHQQLLGEWDELAAEEMVCVCVCVCVCVFMHCCFFSFV